MNNKNLKLTLLGESTTGKSTIVSRLLTNKFNESTGSTIGASFSSWKIDDVKYEIWDTAGQERFRCLCPIYFRASSGCICVFDVSDRKSFDNIDEWIRSFLDHASNQNTSNSSNLQVLLLANKTDLHYSNWAVSLDEISKKAKSLNCPFILTSTINMFNFDKFRECIKHQYLNLAIKTPTDIIVPEIKSILFPTTIILCSYGTSLFSFSIK